MSLWKFLVGSPDAASKTASAVRDGLDAIVYTDEEKAENAQKVRDWYVEYMKATNGQNVARRLIAIIVTAEWALFVTLWAVLRLCGADDLAKDILQMLTDVISPVFMLVMVFYFTAGAAQRILQSKKG